MISQKERNELIEKPCTIDGKPARIAGRLLSFPIVVSLDGKIEAEFCWEAVKRIMDKDGKFSS